MTAHPGLDQVLELHRLLVRTFGGTAGLRDRGALEAALGRPQATFGCEDLYPDLESKTATLHHSLVMNHPFVDGNKRVGAAAELLFIVNGSELVAADDELIATTLAVARGELGAEALAIWLRPARPPPGPLSPRRLRKGRSGSAPRPASLPRSSEKCAAPLA